MADMDRMQQNTKILEKVIRAVPYPAQIKEIDLVSEDTAIRFRWRGDVYRVSETLGVETCDRGCLVGSDIAILMQALIQERNMR